MPSKYKQYYQTRVHKVPGDRSRGGDSSLERFFEERVRLIKARLAGATARLHAEYVRCGLDQLDVRSVGISGRVGKKCPRLSWYDQRNYQADRNY